MSFSGTYGLSGETARSPTEGSLAVNNSGSRRRMGSRIRAAGPPVVVNNIPAGEGDSSSSKDRLAFASAEEDAIQGSHDMRSLMSSLSAAVKGRSNARDGLLGSPDMKVNLQRSPNLARVVLLLTLRQLLFREFHQSNLQKFSRNLKMRMFHPRIKDK